VPIPLVEIGLGGSPFASPFPCFYLFSPSVPWGVKFVFLPPGEYATSVKSRNYVVKNLAGVAKGANRKSD